MAALVNSTYGLDVSVYDQIAAGPTEPFRQRPASAYALLAAARQEEIRQAAGSRWQNNDLMFLSRVGTPADASHVRRPSAKSWRRPGWIPVGGLRELGHSFVSLRSDADVPIEHISRLVGHSSTTERIYRKQIRPMIVHGADIMDRIFPGDAKSGCLVTHHRP